jgi:hypothetical protein
MHRSTASTGASCRWIELIYLAAFNHRRGDSSITALTPDTHRRPQLMAGVDGGRTGCGNPAAEEHPHRPAGMRLRMWRRAGRTGV